MDLTNMEDFDIILEAIKRRIHGKINQLIKDDDFRPVQGLRMALKIVDDVEKILVDLEKNDG
jgi:hypothetical protein